MVDDGRRTDGRRTDGRTTEHGYTISSPCEPDGSGELKSQLLSCTRSAGSLFSETDLHDILSFLLSDLPNSYIFFMHENKISYNIYFPSNDRVQSAH